MIQAKRLLWYFSDKLRKRIIINEKGIHMTENQALTCIEINPESSASRTIIWLHGLGADGSDFVPVISELNLPKTLGIRFVFPHAPIIPVTINNGFQMRAWYDISGFTIEGIVDEVGIKRSILQVENLIEEEKKQGIPPNNIILAGFSQGAVIALSAGIRSANQLAGIIALSGYYPLTQDAFNNLSDANRNIPIFMAHGTQDPIVPYALGKASYVALKQKGYPISWHSYDMPHSVCAQEVKDISNWLLKTYAYKPG